MQKGFLTDDVKDKTFLLIMGSIAYCKLTILQIELNLYLFLSVNLGYLRCPQKNKDLSYSRHFSVFMLHLVVERKHCSTGLQRN